LVLASPAGTHLPWLKVALASGVHVLCEKPLLASARTDASAVVHTAEEDHAEAKELARAFASAGLLLRENCQWPYTLSDFSKLHPSADLTKASWFEMLMSPSGEGVNRWLELLSHPVILLQEVAPGPVEIIDPHYHQDRELRFTWRTVNRELECLVGIVPDTVYPRPAEFSFDGCLMKRSINQENYQFSFSSGAEEILADDPMPQSVAAFLRELHKAKQHSCAPMNEDLVRRQKVLAELLNARS